MRRAKRLHEPEVWGYRLGFGALGVFAALAVIAVYEPTDVMLDLLGYWHLITIGIGMISGLVAVCTS
jgi:hypothetical protein